MGGKRSAQGDRLGPCGRHRGARQSGAVAANQGRLQARPAGVPAAPAPLILTACRQSKGTIPQLVVACFEPFWQRAAIYRRTWCAPRTTCCATSTKPPSSWWTRGRRGASRAGTGLPSQRSLFVHVCYKKPPASWFASNIRKRFIVRFMRSHLLSIKCRLTHSFDVT